MKKLLVIAGAVATVGLASVAGAHAVSAHGADSDRQTTAQKLATYSNNREQHMKDRLHKAVAAGKLSQVQADALQQKHTEMKAFAEGLKDKTTEERKQAKKAKHQELKKWLEENNIPREYWGKGHMRHMHGLKNK